VVIGRTGLVAWDPATWSHSTRHEIGPHAELELGWTLARFAWGFGYATEAARAVRDWAFEVIAPRRLISLIHPDNVRSQSVARRLDESYEREVLTAGGHPAQVWTT
jgi:RimJ/RimL family protein N-acetyltransferase